MDLLSGFLFYLIATWISEYKDENRIPSLNLEI